MRKVVGDIETDGFLDKLTMMSVAWTYDLQEDKWLEWREYEDIELVRYLNTFDMFIGHNIQGFDVPALEKITPMKVECKLFDTLVAARLRHPDILGGHSLRAWGKRLGVLKGTVTEGDEDVEEVYGVYTPELSMYCQDDVKVNIALLERLVKHFDLDNMDFDPINFKEWKV